ncbi:MAG: hypothetical protein WCI50_07215 [Actinomycetes bacterium]
MDDATAGTGSGAGAGGPVRGRAIEVVTWVANVLFAGTAVPFALGVEAMKPVAAATALVLFLAGLVVWVWALAAAFVRSARGDHIVVTTLFLVEGRVPARARWSLYGALAVCLAVTAVTAPVDPFSVLVPFLPLGLVGLWGARHGEYPRRTLPGVR